MKNRFYILIIGFFSIFSTTESFSQNYESIFGNSSTSWNIIFQGYCDWIESHEITATSDTTIHSNNYKVILGLGGFLREDVNQGKVWYYDTTYHTEYLVMNLGLNYGDVFTIFDYFNVPNTFSVDSVYYQNGLKHVQLNAWTSMCGMGEKIKFIEGSGPSSSFTYQRNFNAGSVASYMLCHFKDGLKVSGNNLFDDSCFVHEVGIVENKMGLNNISVFPNPAKDKINIFVKDKGRENLFLEIYNIFGEKIYAESFDTKKFEIDFSKEKKGVYFYKLRNKQEFFSTGKLILE